MEKLSAVIQLPKKLQEHQNTMVLVRSWINEFGWDVAAQKCIDAGYNNYEHRNIVEMFEGEFPYGNNGRPKEVKKCPECGREQETRFTAETLNWELPVNEKEKCYSCQEKPKTIENINNIIFSAGVPKRFIDASIDDFNEKYRNLFNENNGLYFIGHRGIGKTHLMAAILKHKILIGLKENSISPFSLETRKEIRANAIFVSVPELLLEIRSSFKKPVETFKSTYDTEERDEIDILNEYSNTSTLYLDDIGAEKTSDWVLQTLYLLIDRRYRDMKRTIISSNLSLDELSDKLDDRIASRIAGMCKVIEIKGKDRRVSK